jgi:hypothetical protein
LSETTREPWLCRRWAQPVIDISWNWLLPVKTLEEQRGFTLRRP